MKENLFHVEILQGVYLISSDVENGRSLALGIPSGNSYLIIGQEKALLFDMGINDPDAWEYIRALTEKPIMPVLSHGHFDHAFHLNLLEEVWLHPEDMPLIRDGMLGLPPVSPCPVLHPVQEGDVIDLGGRMLEVYHVPGHTMGSILLLDRKTRTLFSGDTCARRLLYGISGEVPLEAFCADLERLKGLGFDYICSAHDRSLLPRAYIDHMLMMLRQELPRATEVWSHPLLQMEMVNLHHGDMATAQFFDGAFPKKYSKEV